MLKTSNYKNQILELYSQGMLPVEIAQKLNFKYHQPVYNLLIKENVFKKQRFPKGVYTLDKTFFQEINTEEKAYVLGFLCADGHIAYNRIKITLSTQDIDHLEKIKLVLSSNAKLKFNQRPNPYLKGKPFCDMVTVSFNSIELVIPLLQAGITSNKTYTLSSDILKIVPEVLVRHFLRGYFDGDGNVLYGKQYSSGTKYNINICGNKEFLLGTFQKYFPSTNALYFEKKSKQTHVWKLSSKEKVEQFLDYLYKDATIYLDRKYLIYKNAHIKPL